MSKREAPWPSSGTSGSTSHSVDLAPIRLAVHAASGALLRMIAQGRVDDPSALRLM